MKPFVVVIASFVLAGCSMFTRPRDMPLITDAFRANEADKSSFALAATDANRRVAIVDILQGHICVEPPPEAANTISEALAVLMDAEVKDKGTVGASLSQSMSQNISQLYRRTQTVQLYRDAVFALCQSAINGSLAISASTRAPIPPELRQQIEDAISLLGTDQYSYWAPLFEMKNEGSYGSKLLEGLAASIPKVPDESTRSQLRQIVGDLRVQLSKAEFRQQLEAGLREAFATLNEELPRFYEAEQLRFLAELAKPVEVCETSYAPKKPGDDKQEITHVVCHAEMPETSARVAQEYIKALNSRSSTQASIPANYRSAVQTRRVGDHE